MIKKKEFDGFVPLLERIDDMIIYNLLYEDITKMGRDECIKSLKTSERLALIQVKSFVVDVLKATKKDIMYYFLRDDMPNRNKDIQQIIDKRFFGGDYK